MSKTRELLQRNTDGRYFTVVDYAVKGRYPRIYLKTKNEKSARRRLAALAYVEDTDEAKRRIDYLDDATTESEERARLAELLHEPKLTLAVTVDDARDELIRLFREWVDEDLDELSDETAERWRRASSPQEWKNILVSLGMDDHFLAEHPDIYADILPRAEKVNPEWVRRNQRKEHEAVAALFHRDPDSFKDEGASKERLSDCLSVWEEYQRLDGHSDDHIRAYARIFQAFIDVVGDTPVNRLEKAQFVTYEKHVKAAQGDRSNKWYNDQFVPIAAILKLARKKSEATFPDGLRDWIEFDKKPHTVASSNRAAMPVEVFQALTAKAEEWADMDVEQHLANLKIEGKNPNLILAGKKKQALTMKRAGTVWSAILRICCNCGCDSVDVARMEWSKHLATLDSDFPFMDVPRKKMEHATGNAIERMTPLLSSTVKALKRLRELRQGEPSQFRHLVFANDAKRPFTSTHLSRGFDRLRSAIDNGNGWNLKHLRNVGPTLGKRHKRPQDERDAFLGHAVGGRGTSRWYEDDVDEHYLTELVNLIGAEYFDGEQAAPLI